MSDSTADSASSSGYTSRVTSRALHVTLINGIGALFALLLHVALARILGTAEYGHYVFIVALATLLGTVCLLGFDTASLRFVAEYQEKHDLAALFAFRRFARLRVLFTALLLGLAWSAFAVWPLVSSTIPRSLQIAGAALLFSIAYAQLHGSMLQGEGRATESQTLQLLIRPALILVAGAALSVAALSPSATHLVLVTCAATLVTGAWMQWKCSPVREAAEPVAPSVRRTWRSTARSMLGLAIANQVLATGDIVIASALLPAVDVGIYGAALRMAAIVSFATLSFNFILAPTIATLYTRRDMVGLQRTVSQLTITASGFALLVLIAIAVFGQQILHLFGNDFSRGYAVLMVLGLGQAVLSANGAVGFLMTMTNNHELALRVVAVSAAILVVLALVLGSRFGIVGIAVAAAVATSFRSITLHYFVRKRLSMKTASFRELPGLVRDAIRKAKRMGRARFPRLYGFLHAIYYPFLREARLISKVGLRGLFRQVVTSRSWREALPMQAIRQVTLSESGLTDLDVLQAYLRDRDTGFSAGGHCIYLPPDAIARTAFAEAVAGLPGDVGLKLLKNPYTDNEIKYLHGPGHSLLQRAITYSPAQMVLVANLLHTRGLAPRVFDFMRIRSGTTEWFAYAIEHCEGRVPTMEECEAAIGKLKALEKERVLTVTVPGGYSHPDLTCPSCNGNALTRTRDGTFQYLDFQNFVLEDHERFLTALAREAVEATHFGDRSIFRGGGYLYQSIPGVTMNSKRATDSRSALLSDMFRTNGVSLEGKLVLDVGCNLGMMMAQYLSVGAAWCHGWDRKTVIEHTERILLAIGCTRFSLTGTDLSGSYDLGADIPSNVRHLLNGCVVSYLSIKGHVGWISALTAIPWGTMIIEGHEDESTESFDADLASFCSAATANVRAKASIKDGDSGTRQVAILGREHR